MKTSRPRPGTSCCLHADIMTHVQLTWSRKRCVNGLAVWRAYKTPLTARRLIAIAIWHSRVQRNLAQCWKSYSKRGVLKFPDWGGDQKRTVPDSRWKFQVQFVSFSKKIGLGWLSDSLCLKRPCLKMKENPKPNLRQKILRSEDIQYLLYLILVWPSINLFLFGQGTTQPKNWDSTGSRVQPECRWFGKCFGGSRFQTTFQPSLAHLNGAKVLRLTNILERKVGDLAWEKLLPKFGFRFRMSWFCPEMDFSAAFCFCFFWESCLVFFGECPVFFRW